MIGANDNQPMRTEAGTVRLDTPAWTDVGVLNGRPFFVTASMARNAALVEHFEKSPMRGVLPYVLSAVYKYFPCLQQQ